MPARVRAERDRNDEPRYFAGPRPNPRLPINTGPYWLRRPAVGRERWYYGFLETYARLLKTCGVVAFGRVRANANSRANVSPRVRHAGRGSRVLDVLLPTLFTVAFVFPSVDAARNLRAIRKEGRPAG